VLVGAGQCYPTYKPAAGRAHMKQVVLGIDVGTGSARAGLFDLSGELLGVGKHDILLHHGTGGIVEHEIADIRAAVCAATKSALSSTDGIDVIGIGVDAACSLVVEVFHLRCKHRNCCGYLAIDLMRLQMRLTLWTCPIG